MAENCKKKLLNGVFKGFYNEDELPTTDKDMFVMLRGLNLVEVPIGPFADFNISVEKQAELGITDEKATEVIRKFDVQKEELIRKWEAEIMDYVCEVKGFSRRSKAYQEWLEMIIGEYNLHSLEWTINMYKWALRFLEIMRYNLIKDMLEGKYQHVELNRK